MSSTTKTIISLIVLIVIILAGWTWYELSQPAPAAEMNQTPVAAPQSAAPATPTAATDTTGMSSASDSSDAAIQQDANAVDSQINGLNSDTSNLSNQ